MPDPSKFLYHAFSFLNFILTFQRRERMAALWNVYLIFASFKVYLQYFWQTRDNNPHRSTASWLEKWNHFHQAIFGCTKWAMQKDNTCATKVQLRKI